MPLIDRTEIRQQVRALQVEHQFHTAKDPVEVLAVPAAKPAQASLLKSLEGNWVISNSDSVQRWLVSLGWWHRGLYGADIYWRR